MEHQTDLFMQKWKNTEQSEIQLTPLMMRTENVLRVAKKYYEKLYTAEETDKSMQNQILSKTTAKITNEQKNMCDDMINSNELYAAITIG